MRAQLFVAVGLVLGTVGCGARLGTIRIREEATVTIPKGTVLDELIGDFGFNEFTAMDLTESSELQNQGVDPGDIRDVRMELFELEAVDPESADLSFLRSMTIEVEAPGLDARVIAEQDEFADGESLVSFDLPDVDLTDYVVSESMTFTNAVSGNQPRDETQVTARFTVAVGVTGRGVFGGGGGGE